MNELVEYLVNQVFPGIPPSNEDSLINVCAVDAITPLPNYLLQCKNYFFFFLFFFFEKKKF